MGNSFLIMAWDALVAHDMLLKMLLHTRPYEVNAGDSDAVFDKYIKEIEKETENPKNKPEGLVKLAKVAMGKNLDYLVNILEKARMEFENVKVERTKKPMVGVVGEFFVRQHEPSNFYLVRTLERMGCEVWMAPGTEFLGYSNYISGFTQKMNGKKPTHLMLSSRFTCENG
jgi:predicted nucleotide-binding protein (sugar kinase/HSP70/actin superfamily)